MRGQETDHLEFGAGFAPNLQAAESWLVQPAGDCSIGLKYPYIVFNKVWHTTYC
jgi:hypothetical protein